MLYYNGVMSAYYDQLADYQRKKQEWYNQHGKYLQGQRYNPVEINKYMTRDQLAAAHRQMDAQHQNFMGTTYKSAQGEQQRQHAEWKQKRGGWKKWALLAGGLAGAMFIPGAQALLGKAFGALGKGAGKIFGIKGAGAAAKAPAIAGKPHAFNPLISGFKAPALKPFTSSTAAAFKTPGFNPILSSYSPPALKPHGGGLFRSLGRTFFGQKPTEVQNWWGKGQNIASRGIKGVNRARDLFGGQPGMGADKGPSFGPQHGNYMNPQSVLNIYGQARLPNPYQSASMFMRDFISPRRNLPNALMGFGMRYPPRWTGHMGGAQLNPWM